MRIDNKDLKKRIVEISYKHQLSHIGSCLSAVDIIEDIYQQKRPQDKFILSSGHAGLALYVVLEAHNNTIDAETLLELQGIHPDRMNPLLKEYIDCSTGSLGQGLPIAIGMAIASPDVDIYCLISDGEMAEGSMWEALRIAEDQNLKNLHIYLNANGWGAYGQVKLAKLYERLKTYEVDLTIVRTSVEQLPFLKGQSAHYYTMNEKDYKLAMQLLK